MKKMTDIEKNTKKLLEASQRGQLEEVKKWLPVSNPKAYESYALRLASQFGHTEIVKLLIPVSDPTVNLSEALRLSSQNGHIDIVKLLIPVSDPKAKNSEALHWACDDNNQELFDVLYPVSEPEKALEWMIKENKKGINWNTVLLEERLKSEHEKKKIQIVLQNRRINNVSHKQKKL